MPRRKPAKEDLQDSDSEHEEELAVDGEPPHIDPYEVLDLEKTATADQVKQAYRKSALRHHPDKAPENLKDEATTKFQQIAFAYAVLSDPIRRARYDKTGSTSESISADDFNWSAFYSEQFKDVISGDAIATFSKAYKGSDEEKDDVLAQYTAGKGKWSRIYEFVMLSNARDDEERFRGYIDEAIANGDVEAYAAYKKEKKGSKAARMKAAGKEEAEAMRYAKKLGVSDKLFGKSGEEKKDKSEDSLAALIQKRQQSRAGLFDALEAKYGGSAGKAKKGARKGKKRALDEDEDEDEEEPSEEAFQAAAARLKKAKAAEGETRTKRVKR